MKKIMLITFLLTLISNSAYSQKAYQIKCRKDLLEMSEEAAISQIGIRERTGRNDGEVEKYLKAVGLGQGNPYCAAGQYWCFWRACQILKIPTKYIPIPNTALVYNIYKFARKKGSPTAYKAKRHSLIVWQYKNRRRGHIERIIKVEKAGWVETVAFNTSAGKNKNQRDGEGVYRKKRNIYHLLGRMKIKCLVIF